MDKDIEVKDNSNTLESVLFSNNHDLLFILKKTQKIAYAVFMITDLIDMQEPIRMSLRKTASDLIKLSLSLSKNSRSERTFVCESLLMSLFETRAFCEAGYFARVISGMNYQVIRKEIELITKTVETKMDKRFVLEESFLDVGSPESYKGQNIGHPTAHTVPYKKPEQALVTSKTFIKKDITQHTQNRAQTILLSIKKGQELTIKDIAVSVTGCSEKTIQRELLALVAKGVLKKKGERRWSRYSLV